MVNFSSSEAIALVRRNLDEQDPNGSIMYEPTEVGSTDAYGDNRSLDGIVMRNIPEAINMVHRAAPVWLLEGVELESGDIALSEGSSPAAMVSLGNDGILAFTMKGTTEFLRLVSFRAADSDIVVTDIIPEASPEGRKQLNGHIRGWKERPRLVQLQGRQTGPSFKYYRMDPDGSDFTGYQAAPLTAFTMEYLQEQFYIAPTVLVPYPSYPISRRLRQNIVDYLTAKVMETFGDQRAQAFYNKASVFPSI